MITISVRNVDVALTIAASSSDRPYYSNHRLSINSKRRHGPDSPDLGPIQPSMELLYGSRSSPRFVSIVKDSNQVASNTKSATYNV